MTLPKGNDLKIAVVIVLALAFGLYTDITRKPAEPTPAAAETSASSTPADAAGK